MNPATLDACNDLPSVPMTKGDRVCMGNESSSAGTVRGLDPVGNVIVDFDRAGTLHIAPKNLRRIVETRG